MPAENELESYPWYTADYRKSGEVLTMSAAEQGVYRNLLDICWTQGYLPSDIDALERLSFVKAGEFRKAWPKVSRCFFEVDGVLHNRKVDAKRPDVLASKRSRVKGANVTNAKRWNKKSESLSDTEANRSNVAQWSPPPSPSPSLMVEGGGSLQEQRTRSQPPPPPPDPIDGLAEDTLHRMATAESATVSDLDGREIALILIDSPNPRTVADALVRDRKAYMDFQVAAGQKAKPLRYWLRDGGWKIPLPTARPPATAESDDPLTRLLKGAKGMRQ